MSKRTRKESGEEKVTAKSRPMMNLIARSKERAPSALSSTASESLVKTRHESQNPLSPQAENIIERWDPSFAVSERLKNVSLVNTRTSFWKKKKITIERWDPLFALSERNWYPNNHMRSMGWNNYLGKLHGSICLWWWTGHQSSTHKKIYVFSDSVLCLGKIHENPQSNNAWEDRLEVVKIFSKLLKLWQNRRWANGIRAEYFPGFNTLQLVREVQELLLRLSVEPEDFIGRIIFMSMFNDISWWSRDNKKECESNAQLVSLYLRQDSELDNGHSSDLDRRKWYSISADSPQGEWDRMAEKMMLEFGECGHPVSRATSPLSRGTLKSKGGGKLSIHFCADQEMIKTFFSHNYFCKSAQSLRSSRRNVWRIWILSR